MILANTVSRRKADVSVKGKKRQVGLTLVELMIGMTLGVILLIAVGSIYLGSKQTYRVQEDNGRMQEAGRYALEAVGRSLRQAGFWNIPVNPVAVATGFGGTPITGANGAGTAPDTVTVQYDGLVGDRDCEGNVLGANAVIQDSFQLDTVNSELECDGNADGAVDPRPLVSDIEDLQILYGIDADGSGDQAADRYTAAPATWAQVVTARACVLVRSANDSLTTTPQRYLNCQGALNPGIGGAGFTTAADRRLRRTFVATFNLRNRVNVTP